MIVVRRKARSSFFFQLVDSRYFSSVFFRPGRWIMKHTEIVGRKLPDEKDKDPKIYKSQIFAKNAVIAKSKFWTLMREQNKVKKAQGQVDLYYLASV